MSTRRGVFARYLWYILGGAFLFDFVVYLDGFSLCSFLFAARLFLFWGFLGFCLLFLFCVLFWLVWFGCCCCFLNAVSLSVRTNKWPKKVSYLMTLKPKALILTLAFSQSQVLCASVAELDTLEMSLSRSVVLDCISCYIRSFNLCFRSLGSLVSCICSFKLDLSSLNMFTLPLNISK